MKEKAHLNIPDEFHSPSAEFSKAMESMDVHWWFYDVAEQKLHLGPKLIELLGYRKDEFDPYEPSIGKNIHRNDIKQNEKLFSRLLSGDIHVYEYEYRLKINGQWKLFYNRASVLSKGKDKKPLLVGGITMDISARFDWLLKRVQETKKLEFIFKNSSQPILILEINEPENRLEIKEMNQALIDLFGYSPDDIMGRDPFDFNPEVSDKMKSELLRQIDEKGSLKFNPSAVDAAGKTRFLEVHAYSTNIEGKRIVVTIITDKTETRVIESALRESESMYRKLLESAEDRIGLFKLNGEPVIINSAFSGILGYNTKEFLELDELARVHPEDKQRLMATQPEFFEKGNISVEYRVRHKNGRWLYMSSKGILLRGDELVDDYVLYIIRDITKQKKAEKELRKAKEKAEESDMLKSAFLANMSHEIRTPMNSIVGFANLLTEKGLDEESRLVYVERINRNSEHLLALISDIIDLSKIESNQLSISPTNVYLDHLFKELVSYTGMQLVKAGKQGINVEYAAGPELEKIQICIDRVRLLQILQNLINNAIKFTSAGSITIGYEQVAKNSIRLFVKDTGIGIDKKHFELIFDQFRQLDGSHTRQFGGTGLGLAISRQLTDLLGGRIWVESKKGKGSDFFVDIPLGKGGHVKPSGPSTKVRLKNRKPNKISVLLADDDKDSMTLLSTILKQEGMHVIAVRSGYRVLQKLESGPEPDIVLLDLQMPTLNGLQTMKIIKELYPGLKVVAQTAYALDGDRAKFLAAGFDGYFAKPFNKGALLSEIQQVLDK